MDRRQDFGNRPLFPTTEELNSLALGCGRLLNWASSRARWRCTRERHRATQSVFSRCRRPDYPSRLSGFSTGVAYTTAPAAQSVSMKKSRRRVDPVANLRLADVLHSFGLDEADASHWRSDHRRQAQRRTRHDRHRGHRGLQGPASRALRRFLHHRFGEACHWRARRSPDLRGQDHLRERSATSREVAALGAARWSDRDRHGASGSVFRGGRQPCNSCDSRTWGTVPRSDIIAKAFVRIWPFTRIGFL
jgi:hypothetical protein